MTTKPLDRISSATPLMPWLDRHDACDEAVEEAMEAGWATLGEAWDQCTSVHCLLWGLAQEGYADDPVLRLFACRCIRETPLVGGGVVSDLLTDSRSQIAVATAERFALGHASTEELAAAHALAGKAASSNAASAAAQAAVWASSQVAAGKKPSVVVMVIGMAAGAAAWAARNAAWEARDEAWMEATRFQVNLLRQMIDPFHADRS